MATIYDASLGSAAEAKDSPSLFKRFWGRLIEARQQEATRRIRQHLRTLDPATLRDFGYSEDQIADVYK
ncbi:MAG TPA: hypothetical protein VKA94_02435 [Hyphomicrobiales bacterium]|nr:hypothetical protein [Hyphomicrobiales bacterium]